MGPGKEWKPKSTNPNVSQSATAAPSSDVSTVSIGSQSESLTTAAVLTSKESTLELQKKLEEAHISESQHVIIPNHLHVPEVEKLGFCFGSFDASFALDINQNGLPGDKSPSMSESTETIDEPVKDLELRCTFLHEVYISVSVVPFYCQMTCFGSTTMFLQSVYAMLKPQGSCTSRQFISLGCKLDNSLTHVFRS